MEIKVDTGKLRHTLKSAFDAQKSHIQDDLTAIHRQGTVHEAALEGRVIENRRMMMEVDAVIMQLQLDAENARSN